MDVAVSGPSVAGRLPLVEVQTTHAAIDRYDTHSFTNSTGSEQCVSVTVTNSCCAGGLR